ncbi:ATP-binding domain-containing protein [uncultured Thiothrix sp.]|uniref:ATP-binding domain-containing protein n=1 Tax=uncultured Thiothrix sp. TaxID=223185 RepID=UPI002625DAF1|nr:ATP-binding domain-containing protein [uncultured Thiothrix sp.]HMT94258.1 ATP-binding domain-containing protein [Thiolinea sp.]
MTDQQHIKVIAEEALHTFDEIAAKAELGYKAACSNACEAPFASVNSFTTPNAANRIGQIFSSNREGYHLLLKEPAIARIVVEDEDGHQRTIYISRKYTVPMGDSIELASYKTAFGRLAALDVCDELTVEIGDQKTTFTLLEKSGFRPVSRDNKWDSERSVFEGEDYGPITVSSLLDWLSSQGLTDSASELEALLAGSGEVELLEGLHHEVRISMGLRDQPILDKFQDEIFRLPLDSQLLILGPPGTGKTTTLIRRLGQKIDPKLLDSHEKAKVRKIMESKVDYSSHWLMFTPTDLLKHYVKEAFNREQIPASDQRIRTWDSYRSELARNVLGILQSATSEGKFIYKPKLQLLLLAVGTYPNEWFDSFSQFHAERIYDQLQQGITLLKSLRTESNASIIDKLETIVSDATPATLIRAYQAIEPVEADIAKLLTNLKSVSDKNIRTGLVTSFKKNKEFLRELAVFLDDLKADEETEDGDEDFDDENTESTPSVTTTSAQKAEKAYNQAIRSLARYKFLKRSIPKGSHLTKMQNWLATNLPSDEMLITIGENIATQNGLRRFVNPSRRYISDIPASYREFRKQSFKDGNWYQSLPDNNKHIGSMELDGIILLMLKNTRSMLSLSYVSRNVEQPRYSLVKIISDRFQSQVLVDEATDFSSIQLACMANLTHMETNSFFACGDFNQRITTWGVRSLDQVNWVSKGINIKQVQAVYRQSQKLNEFSSHLLQVMDGETENRGSVPTHAMHTGFEPVLVEGCSENKLVVKWLSERIQEVERSVRQMPTIAVLVNHEDEVKPVAEALNELLEDVNLKAVACTEGKSLGEGTEVRVFDVQHIKGLEFEAVFFVGIDRLAAQIPDLFGKYLYVGATRAATYFGMTCDNKLPEVIEPLRDSFREHW